MLSLPGSLEVIERRAFARAKLQTLNLSNTKLRSIGAAAFETAPLTRLALPDTVEWIDQHAFYHSTAKLVWDAPKLVIVGKKAFYNTEHVKLHAPVLPSLGDDAFTMLTGLIIAPPTIANLSSNFAEQTGLMFSKFHRERQGEK